MKFLRPRISLLGFFVAGVVASLLLQKFLPGIYPRNASQNSPESTQASTPSQPIPSKFQGNLALFILAGQSNMSGKGKLDQQSKATHSQIFSFGNDYRWHVAKEPLDEIKDQVDFISREGKSPGVGPGISFAKTLLKHNPDLVIGLIPCAKGGSTIQGWQKKLSEDTLYGSCLKRYRAASLMGSLKGLLFFQGEADALDKKKFPDLALSPQSWSPKFRQFVQDFRADTQTPNLPIIYAQIGTHGAPDLLPHWEAIKKQQEEISLPYLLMITTDDLPLQDYVHYTTKSYRTIGKRFANAYIKLTD